jgi:hypothetical protein
MPDKGRRRPPKKPGSGTRRAASKGNEGELFLLCVAAIWRLNAWFRRVPGYRPLEKDEVASYALELAWLLSAGTCGCWRAGGRAARGRRRCGNQHDLRRQPGSGLSLRDFVFRAVIGPAGLRASSIVQGMGYWVMKDRIGLVFAMVEFKHCTCGRKYEGSVCNHGDCRLEFDETLMKMGAEPRFIDPHLYTMVRRWACGKGGLIHYYRQDKCREVDVGLRDDMERPKYGLNHCNPHDHCPWVNCPLGNPRHHQKGATLYVRSSPGDGAMGGTMGQVRGPIPDDLYDAIMAACCEAVNLVPLKTWIKVTKQCGGDSLEAMVKLIKAKSTPEALRARLLRTFQRELTHRGFDQDILRAFESRGVLPEEFFPNRGDDNA